MAYLTPRTGKRKLTLEDSTAGSPYPKRISPFLNTPKQRREEKRKVLRMSIQKLRQIDDPECLLHRSVLINNTMKRLQRELKEEKPRASHWWSHWEVYGEDTVLNNNNNNTTTSSQTEKLSHLDYEVINNDHLVYNSNLFDNDPDVDKVTKEMTVELCKTVDSVENTNSKDVKNAESSCGVATMVSSSATQSDCSSPEPLNLSTSSRTSESDSQLSCNDIDKAPSSSATSSTVEDCQHKCLCLSVSVCDCDITSDHDSQSTETDMDITMTSSSQSKTSSPPDVCSSLYSFSNTTLSPTSSLCIPPLDFSASTVSSSTASSSSSCFDSFGKLDYDFDCFPTVSDHERHMNEFDTVFNNLISVLTGS